MASEMQIRGVAVEPVDLDDFVLPTTSRPRRSVPRKDYLAMLDAHKSVKSKHDYTSPTKKLSSPQKTSSSENKTPDKKTPHTELQEDDSDEQLKSWKILVKHNLISQVNQQICGQSKNEKKNVEDNNDENSRQNCINKILNTTSTIHSQQQNTIVNLKSEQVQNIFNHFKWFRDTQDHICSSNFELSSTFVKKEFQDNLCEVPVKSGRSLPIATSSVTCKMEQKIKQEPPDVSMSSKYLLINPVCEEEMKDSQSEIITPEINTNKIKATKKFDSKSDEVISKDIKKRKYNYKREKKFQCTYCCKMFFTKANLNSHIMVHSGIKPFECNICKRKFSQIGNLQNHLARIHLGEKKYTCKFCKQKFTELGNVQRHEKSVHDFNQKFECEMCKYRFKIKKSLKVHLETHHIGKILKCFHCKKICKVLPSLYEFIVKNKRWNTFKCAKCNTNSKFNS